jgi:Flp pilus assembly secretin CpaC
MRLCCVFALVACAACHAFASGKDAGQLFEQGRKAERAGRVVEAYLLYSQAAAQAPQKLEYWQRAQALRSLATVASQAALPATKLDPAGTGSVRAPESVALEVEAAPAAAALPLAELVASEERKSLSIKGDAKSLFTQVARAYGLEAVFDTDYAAGSSTVFAIDDADYKEAIRGLEAATGSFVIPESSKRILVAKDTPQKRLDLEPQVVLEIPVPDTVTDAETQEIVNAVRTVMQVQRAGYDGSRRTVVIRARASLATPAKALMQQLLRRKAVVAIELELVETNQSNSSTYGASLQTYFPLRLFGDPLRSRPVIPAGFASFLTFGGGSSLFGLGVLNAQVLATATRITGETLFHMTLRSLDGQESSIVVGEKYPVVTAKQMLASASTEIYPPSFSFQDLGLSVKATPRTHGSDEMTLRLEASFKALTGEVVEEVPVIANRSIQTEVRLKNGEWALIAGLMASSEGRTISGLEGLSRVPLVDQVLSRRGRESPKKQVLLLIRPTLVSLPPSEAPTPPVPSGSETRPPVPL